MHALAAFGVQLDPPLVHCTTVDIAGNVTLTWTPITDPGGDFQQYDIFHSNSLIGPYVPVTSIFNVVQSSWVHVGAGGNTGAQYYYISTVSNTVPNETSVPSDTLSTIFLQVNQSTPLGRANLTWNASPLASSSDTVFTIWMEYPIGNWMLIDSVSTTLSSYQHIVDVCEDSLTFRVRLSDASGCVSASNFAGDVFADATPPSMPVITVVSVDTLTGLTSVNWAPSPEPDTDGYIILWVTPTGGVIIDTLYGQFNTTYTWQGSNPDIGAESFAVAAFDTCEVGVPPSPNTSATRPPHSTLYLVAQYDLCAAQVELSWTEYVGWTTVSYQLFVQVDGGAWTVLNNLPAGQTSYVHNVSPGRTYCYVLKAIQGPSLAFSFGNKVCIASNYPQVPAFNYIQTVTVTGDDQITIVDNVDMNAASSGFRLERSVNGGPYLELNTFPGSAGPIITTVDVGVDVLTTGYRYRFIVLDSCGHTALTSNIGGNILLRATPDLYGNNTLVWNGYEDWAGVVDSYTIYRKIADMPYTLLATVPPQPWVYVDPVQDFTTTDGDFCYYVVANESGDPTGIDTTSVSNVACAIQQELIYIPNAFVIGGSNPVFYPVLSYVDIRQYELSIINRWGQVIWQSLVPEVGWDGRLDKGCAPIGVYGYYLSVRNGAGRHIERRGTVTLIAAGE